MSDFYEILSEIEELKCKDYWLSVVAADWDITEFDKYITKRKNINKRFSHLIFSNDIAILKNSFVDNEDVVKKLTSLETQLRSVKKNQVNTIFWQSEYPNIKKSKRKNTEEAGQSANKRTHIALTERGTSHEDLEEIDGVVVDGEKKSVGSIIKAAALDIHQKKYLKGIVLTNRERNIMSSGLSSTLDLIDTTHSSQKSLFTGAQWSQLVNLYTNKYKPMKSHLPVFVSNTIQIVTETIISTADVYKGIRYINKILGAHDGDNLCMLEAIKTILTNMLDKPEFFIKSNPEKLNEADYLRILWSPLFESLFKSEHCIVKIKTGESVYKFTTTNKAETYHEAKKVIGFKIDIRFTTRIDNEQFDFGCGEVGISDANTKVLEDEGKLLREAKEIIDNLLYNCKAEDDHHCYAWTIQISGSNCFVGALHLDANGLYVAVPYYSFSLPSDILDLSNLPDILSHLIKMKFEMNRTAMAVLKSKKSKHSVGFALGHGKNEIVNQRLEWIRDTWFTPPRKSESKIPTNLYMGNPRNLTDELLRAKHSDSNLPEDDADEFGWTKRGDKWYNYVTKETLDKSPYGN